MGGPQLPASVRPSTGTADPLTLSLAAPEGNSHCCCCPLPDGDLGTERSGRLWQMAQDSPQEVPAALEGT